MNMNRVLFSLIAILNAAALFAAEIPVRQHVLLSDVYTIDKVYRSMEGPGSINNVVLGDGGPAERAQLRQPHSIAFGPDGNLLICDIGNHRIRSVDIKTGVIDTFSGTGERVATPGQP